MWETKPGGDTGNLGYEPKPGGDTGNLGCGGQNRVVTLETWDVGAKTGW